MKSPPVRPALACLISTKHIFPLSTVFTLDSGPDLVPSFLSGSARWLSSNKTTWTNSLRRLESKTFSDLEAFRPFSSGNPTLCFFTFWIRIASWFLKGGISTSYKNGVASPILSSIFWTESSQTSGIKKSCETFLRCLCDPIFREAPASTFWTTVLRRILNISEPYTVSVFGWIELFNESAWVPVFNSGRTRFRLPSLSISFIFDLHDLCHLVPSCCPIWYIACLCMFDMFVHDLFASKASPPTIQRCATGRRRHGDQGCQKRPSCSSCLKNSVVAFPLCNLEVQTYHDLPCSLPWCWGNAQQELGSCFVNVN